MLDFITIKLLNEVPNWPRLKEHMVWFQNTVALQSVSMLKPLLVDNIGS